MRRLGSCSEQIECQLLSCTDKVWEGLLLIPSAAGQLPPALLGKHAARCSGQLSSSKGGGDAGMTDRTLHQPLGGSNHSKTQTASKREVREIEVKAAKETGRENSNKYMFLGFSQGLLMVSALMYSADAGCAQLNSLWHLQSGG